MQIDPRDFVERMALPMWQAAAIARFLEQRVENRPKIEEETPAKSALTDADCVSQEILLGALRGWYPWVDVEVEEDTPLAAVFAGNRSEQQVVIDPIDGTLLYIQGDGIYAIILGLERGGLVEAALVAVPQEDALVRAVRGGGAEIAYGGGAFRPATVNETGGRLLVSPEFPPQVEAGLLEQGVTLLKAAGGTIGVSPLLAGTRGALRFSDGPPGLSRRNWIATLPTLEAGGALGSLDGPFPERHREGVQSLIVAASQADLEILREKGLGL